MSVAETGEEGVGGEGGVEESGAAEGFGVR